jgi:Flp pilus assembly protein TadD
MVFPVNQENIMRVSLVLAGLFLSSSVLAAGKIAEPLTKAAPSKPANEAQLREQYITAGQNLLVKGDFENAMRFFERALASEENPEALMGAGSAMLNGGKPVDSTSYFNRLVSARPADPRGYIGLARAYNTAYRPDDALAALKSIPVAGARGQQALQETGIAYDLLGRNKEAQTIYSDALKLAPKNLDVLRRMAMSFAISGDYPTALSLLNKVAAEPGGIATVKVPLSMVYALDSQFDAAERIMGTSEDPRVGAQRSAFFHVLPTLSSTDKARALHFNYVENDLINVELSRIQQNKVANPKYVLAPENPIDSTPARPQVISPKTKPQSGKPQLIALPQPDDNNGLVLDANGQTATPAISSPMVSGSPVRAQPLPPADRFWVQLGVANNRQKLLGDWNRAAAKSSGGLGGFAPYLQPDILKAQAVMRLVVGGYADASTAQALMSRLKSSGVPVYLTRNALPADPLFP